MTDARRPHPAPPAPGDVAPGHALNWLSEGWRLFMKAPGVWAIQALIFFVILTALGLMPFLGWAAAPIALPVLVGGMIAGAQALDRGESLRVDHLFDGVRHHAGNLLLVGVVVFTVLWALLMMALWFAPALVMLHEMAPLDAMRLSARACIHNLLAFLILAALLYVLLWVAMLPAGLGMLVLIPVIACALYAAWKETFAPQLPASLPIAADGPESADRTPDAPPPP